MRQVISSGSVKAFSINQTEIIELIQNAAHKVKNEFPEIKEIWLFGSLATNTATGLSDIDVLIVADTKIQNPVERIKPYYMFLSNLLPIAIDILVTNPEEVNNFNEIVKYAIKIA